MNYSDIPKFPVAHYHTDVNLQYLKDTLDRWNEPDRGTPLILNPDWQRGHVWNARQKTTYMEYLLQGGTMGREIFFNCSSWQHQYNTPVYCVDGLQRITAILDFMDNKVPVFGHLKSDIEGRLPSITVSLNMLKVRNKKELLKIYHNFNVGATPHSKPELARIAQMIEDTDPNELL